MPLTKHRVIHADNLPARVPVWPSVVILLVLDRLHDVAGATTFGVVSTLLVVLLAAMWLGFFTVTRYERPLKLWDDDAAH